MAAQYAVRRARAAESAGRAQAFPSDIYAGANGAKIQEAFNRAPAAWRSNLDALKRGLDAYLDTRRGATPVKARRAHWHIQGLTIQVTPLFALALPNGRIEVIIPWWNKGTPPGSCARSAVHRVAQLVMDDIRAGGTPVLVDFHRGDKGFDRLVGPASPYLDRWLTAEALCFAASMPSRVPSVA